eukprot:3940390-Rhodomonas_salina.2
MPFLSTAECGTEIAYGGVQALWAMRYCGRDTQRGCTAPRFAVMRWGMLLRTHYWVCGTEMGYATTHSLLGVRH